VKEETFEVVASEIEAGSFDRVTLCGSLLTVDIRVSDEQFDRALQAMDIAYPEEETALSAH